MSDCSWMTFSMPTRQCRWPGVFSGGLHGDGKWRCAMHHKLSGEGASDKALSDAIVDDSINWDGNVLDYIEYRAKFQDTPRPKPVHAAERPANVFTDAWRLLRKKREVSDAA